MPWSLASMVIAVVIVIGIVALFDKDISAVSNTILTLLVALGLAELREIRTQTNGSQSSLLDQNRKLMDELAHYRREAARITDRALDSAPLAAPAPAAPAPAPASPAAAAPADSYDPTHAAASSPPRQ